MNTSPVHYSYSVRTALRLKLEGNLHAVRNILVEPTYGYMAQLVYEDGSTRMVYGNDIGLNTAASAAIAQDKVYTKFILRHAGVSVPDGITVLLDHWQQQIADSYSAPGFETPYIRQHDAPRMVEKTFGFPVYLKSLDGSKGQDVSKVYSGVELATGLADLDNKRSRLALIEVDVKMPDYRLVIFRGELVAAYRRYPLAIEGDGHNDIARLIDRRIGALIASGRRMRTFELRKQIINHFTAKGIAMTSILADRESLSCLPISNLSAGGTAVDVEATLDPKWVERAVSIGRVLGLCICGVDLACADITRPDSAYSIIEVNSAPGLDHFASIGEEQRRTVDSFYIRAFRQ